MVQQSRTHAACSTHGHRPTDSYTQLPLLPIFPTVTGFVHPPQMPAAEFIVACAAGAEVVLPQWARTRGTAELAPHALADTYTARAAAAANGDFGQCTHCIHVLEGLVVVL